MKIINASDYKDMSRKAANLISAQIILYPRSVLGLATGDTPIGTYDQLTEWYNKGDLDFSEVTTVNLDEYVGLDGGNAQSYRAFMNTHLFDRVNIEHSRTHVPNGMCSDVAAECLRYEQLIAELGGIDLQLLGLGHNGHIGFNEPGAAFEKMTHCVQLSQTTVEANARFFPAPEAVPKLAITLGMKSIMQAKKILLVVSGEAKREILELALHGEVTPLVPASILQLHNDLTVIYCPEAC